MTALSNLSPALASLLSGLLAATVALFFKPILDDIRARRRERRIYRAQMADHIRDFRESVAVLESILADNKPNVFPIRGHVLKIAIPNHLIINEAVKLTILSPVEHIEGIHVSNELVNINRDTESMLAAISNKHYRTFYLETKMLAAKLRAFADKWEREYPYLAITGPSTEKIFITFEDGTQIQKTPFKATPLTKP